MYLNTTLVPNVSARLGNWSALLSPLEGGKCTYCILPSDKRLLLLRSSTDKLPNRPRVPFHICSEISKQIICCRCPCLFLFLQKSCSSKTSVKTQGCTCCKGPCDRLADTLVVLLLQLYESQHVSTLCRWSRKQQSCHSSQRWVRYGVS